MGFIYASNLFLIIFMSLLPYNISLTSNDPVFPNWSYSIFMYFLFCFVCLLVNQRVQ